MISSRSLQIILVGELRLDLAQIFAVALEHFAGENRRTVGLGDDRGVEDVAVVAGRCRLASFTASSDSGDQSSASTMALAFGASSSDVRRGDAPEDRVVVLGDALAAAQQSQPQADRATANGMTASMSESGERWTNADAMRR